MEVVKLLDNYIEKLDNAQDLSSSDLGQLIEEIARVVFDDSEVMELCLHYYLPYNNCDDCLSDVQIKLWKNMNRGKLKSFVCS